MGCIMSGVDNNETGKSIISNTNQDQDTSKHNDNNNISPSEDVDEDSFENNEDKCSVLDNKVLNEDTESANVSCREILLVLLLSKMNIFQDF